jgi:nitrite reductase/ring-hydroxylating ferredoxin subunit
MMTELPLVGRTVAPDGRPQAEQPPWRQDFPIDTPQDAYVARRDFTRFLALSSVAFALGQVWLVLQKWLRGRRGGPAARPVAPLTDVPVGSVLPFHYPDRDDACLLLRPDEHSLLAFSQKCTHLGCAVVPDPGEKKLFCPCHKGYFDAATGRPLAGPPRRPLPRITLEVRNGVVYATGIEVTAV